MPIYEVTQDTIKNVEETSFSSERIEERYDLQRLLRDRIEVISPDTMVIEEEFGDWEDSRRRIDLLALDKDANLVVVELKRTESGGHMELQAIRYAAMVSTMTFDKVVEAHSRYLERLGRRDDARQVILEFLGWDEVDEEMFAQDTRIILVSQDFSKELTSAVMWMNQHDIDIRCIRLKPYNLDGRLLLDVQQIIPLPEAAEYQVKLREKEARERTARKQKVHGPWTGCLYANVGEGAHRNWDDCREYGFLSAGQGRLYSDAIKRLKPGDRVFAYMKGLGYVGFGEVETEPMMAGDFVVESSGKRLFDLPLVQEGIKENAHDPELSEWLVGVTWKKAFNRGESKTYPGIFANQNVVCKLRDSKTLEFLIREFDITEG